MQILQLTNKFPYPPKDGGAIATLNISLGLTALGHQVTVLGMNTSKHYTHPDEVPEDLKNIIDFRDVKIDTGIYFGAALKNLLFSHLPYNAIRFFDETFTRQLVHLLQEKEFDVVQLEGLYMAYYIDIIRKHSKALISLRAHNIEHEIWERTASQEKSVFKKIYFNILAKRIRRFKQSILNRYDVLLPITERDALKFKEIGNTKPCKTIPAGFDINKLVAKRERIRFPGVFFIGTLDWFPNQEGLVWFMENVWKKLMEEFSELQLHIAGRNAPSWMKKLLKQNPNTTYHGEIDDAYAYINEHAIMIVPLFSGSGMRVKIVEGMALGKTIVTTTIGAEGIPVSPGVNIIIEDEPGEFAQQVASLIRKREEFDRIGENAIVFVRENFDNKKISASLAEFYQNHLS